MLNRFYVLMLVPVFMLAVILTFTRLAWALMVDARMSHRIALSFDQLANTAFGGDPDETISSRAGRHAREGERWACWLCRFLDHLDPNHCEKSIGS